MSVKLRILVVDDSPIVRKAFVRVLGDEYELVEANDGQTAWDMLNQDDDICAVFADMEMEGLDGRELLQWVRMSENEDIKSMPFVLMATERDNQASKLEALEAGVTDFISKPFDSVFLKACARTHVHPNGKMLGYGRSSVLDPLTKLANRTFLFKRGVQEISLSIRNHSYLSLIMIGLKGFERVQQAYGEKASKGLLRMLASALATEVRLEDTVARIGKDQFAVLVSGVDEKGVDTIVGRFRNAVHGKSVHYADTEVSVVMAVAAIIVKPEAFQPFEVMFEMGEQCLSESLLDEAGRFVKRVLAPTVIREKQLPPEIVSLDTAAFLIKHRQYDQLEGGGEYLLATVLPILGYCNDVLKLELSEVIACLQQRVESGR